MTLAQFGTFEVENYGDRLFPIIAQNELSKRLSDWNIQKYSPVAESSLEVRAYNDLLESTKAIIIGGGDIISFASDIASFYQKFWKYNYSPHCACWVLPSLNRITGMPLVWNAPGVPCPFDESEAELLRLLASEADYLSVRDEFSYKHLRQAGVKEEIHVVPDTAMLLAKQYAKNALAERAEKILRPLGLSLDEPLVVQTHPYFIQEHVENVVETLKSLQETIQRPILLLPIGYCHNDHVILNTIYKSAKGDLKIVSDKLELFDTAAIIAHAGAFLGTSLHGNITAYAYGVPFLIFSCAELKKLEGFAQLIQEEDRIAYDLEDLKKKNRLLNKTPNRDRYLLLCNKVEEHFDRIAAAIKQGSHYHVNGVPRSLLKQYLTLIQKNELLERNLAYSASNLEYRTAQAQHLLQQLQRPSLLGRLMNRLWK